MRVICLLQIFLLLIQAVNAQDEYLVGTATVSIEPDSSVFSLALAGYGAPRDGRFSITWEEAGDAPQEIIAFAGQGKKLFAVTANHDLMVKSPAAENGNWTNAGRAENVIDITSHNEELIALTSGSELLSMNTRRGGAWKKLDKVPDAKLVAVVGNNIYILTAQGHLMSKKMKSSSWQKTGKDSGDIAGLAGHGKNLYAINKDDHLLVAKSYMPGMTWSRIGRPNGETFKAKIKKIAVAGNRLYALDDSNKLLLAHHKSKGDLSASTFAVRKGKQTAVIVGIDVCGFDYTLANEIKSAVSKKRNIPASSIFLNASHTHFAPVAQSYRAFGEHGQLPDSIYLDQTVKTGVIRSIEKALDNMHAVTLHFGRGQVHIGHNRSSPDNETPYDSTVDAVYAKGRDKGGSGILFMTACHPVFRNGGSEGYTISANYPGVSKKLIEEKLKVANAVFLQGCAGDINPRDSDHEKSGRDLAESVADVIDSNMEPVSGNIACALDTIDVPIEVFTRDRMEQFKNENSGKEGDVGAEKNVRWANLMLDRYGKGTMPTTMPVYVQTVNIGNWKLVGLSREVVTAYSLAIKQLWPDRLVTVAGYSNDVASYLPAKSHIERKTYEGFDSFFWYAQPGLFPENVLDVVVEKIKENNR